MTKPFRVMLATDYDPEKLRFPVLASPKLDGIRAYVKDGVVLSRQNKPIPNDHVQSLFSKYEHFDGELAADSEGCQTLALTLGLADEFVDVHQAVQPAAVQGDVERVRVVPHDLTSHPTAPARA